MYALRQGRSIRKGGQERREGEKGKVLKGAHLLEGGAVSVSPEGVGGAGTQSCPEAGRGAGLALSWSCCLQP